MDFGLSRDGFTTVFVKPFTVPKFFHKNIIFIQKPSINKTNSSNPCSGLITCKYFQIFTQLENYLGITFLDLGQGCNQY